MMLESKLYAEQKVNFMKQRIIKKHGKIIWGCLKLKYTIQKKMKCLKNHEFYTTKITYRKRNLWTVWTVSDRGDDASDKAVALPRYRILCRCWLRFSCHPCQWPC